MLTRRRFIEGSGSLVTVGSGALAGCSQTNDAATNDDTPAAVQTQTTVPTEGTKVTPELSFEPTAFEIEETIPKQYTCEGADDSPPLAIGAIPDDADSLAMIVDDPDAPGGTFTHWLLWNVPPDTREIPEGIEQTETVEALHGARQGTNDFDEVGYRGPCPPKGDQPHEYRFRLFALDDTLKLGAGAEITGLTDAIRDIRLASAEFTALFGR